MSERPFSERPAARPTPVQAETSAGTSNQTQPNNNFSGLGCFGWFLLVAVSVLLIAIVVGSIQGVFGGIQTSSGKESYEVTPSKPDPRESYPISPECDAAMAASAADPTERGEALLVETGNVCQSRAEWEAALWKYPAAIGGSSTAYLDGSEFDLVCFNNPEVFICRNPE